jgi:PTS system nitrogen regulatory IIA component
MNLDTILGPRSVLLNFRASDKEEALSAISNFAADILSIEPAKVLSALRSREALGSTALGSGFMLPHGKLSELTDTHLFLFRTAPGFAQDFDSPDGLPLKLIALILSPVEPIAVYLKLLSILGRIWESPQNVSRLMSCTDETSLRQTFLLLSGSLNSSAPKN